MKKIAWLLVLMSWCHSSSAGPIAEYFGWGAFGIPWGASLDSVVEMVPVGDHLYAAEPLDRAYLVKDDQEFIGVARSGHHILYGFDKEQRLVTVSLSFPYERKDEILRAAIAAFGAPQRKVSREDLAVFWRDDAGVSVTLWTSLEPKHGTVRLWIGGPKHPSGAVADERPSAR